MSRTFFRRAALLAVAVLPLGGCPLFSVETEIPEMCVAFHNRQIAGVKGGMEFERTIVADPLKSFGAYVELDAEITEARATLYAQSGVSNLAFLDTVTVSLRGVEPNAVIAPMALVDCQDYACASDTMTSELSRTAPVGIMDYLKTGKVELEVRMAGDLPEEDWVVDLEVCVSGKARAAIEL